MNGDLSRSMQCGSSEAKDVAIVRVITWAFGVDEQRPVRSGPDPDTESQAIVRHRAEAVHAGTITQTLD